MGIYHETKWLITMNSMVVETIERKLGKLQLHSDELKITSTERVKLKTLIAFCSHEYPQLKYIPVIAQPLTTDSGQEKG